MNARPLTAAMNSRKDWLSFLPFYIFFILFSLLTLKLPFFWDKDILYSRIAHWLPDHHFTAALPDDLDPGYPPALGYLLALLWKLFGMTLPVMHLTMLPFTLGIVWQTSRLLRQFVPTRALAMAMVLILADPVFLAQTVVYSTDLVMLFFMLLALNSVMHKQRIWLAVAVTGLLFSHMRGTMVAATIGIFDLYRNSQWKKPDTLVKIIPAYLPGMILFGGWMIFHYHTKGWIGYHPGSPWAGCYELVDGAGFVKNCAILVWRLADYGHLFVWLAVILLMIPLLKRNGNPGEPLKQILLLLLVSMVLIFPPMLIYRMLNGHRYLIPVYYFLSLLAVCLIFEIPGNQRIRKILFAGIVVALLTGNFWIYPDKIAKGWDSTLAHLPYHSLRHKMMQYIDQNHIAIEETGSRTPNTAMIDYIELNGDKRAFPDAHLSTDHYVFYSNILNMFTDEEIDRLKRDWVVEKEYRCMLVRVTLYRNPEWGRRK
jgi:hypothetical protein